MTNPYSIMYNAIVWAGSFYFHYLGEASSQALQINYIIYAPRSCTLLLVAECTDKCSNVSTEYSV